MLPPTARSRIGALVVGPALIGFALIGLAVGAATQPKMQVLPSAKGLKYSQTIEVKAQNLPKGSGTIALTICGLDAANGQKIAKPGANDCAGQSDLSSGLVVLQSWSNGSFDQKYTLPKSGQKFGTNQRFCDKTHFCALVVADANPNKPAYEVSTSIFFADQVTTSPTTKPTITKPTTTTTHPAPTTTTTLPIARVSNGVSVHTDQGTITGGGTVSANRSGGSGSGGVTITSGTTKIHEGGSTAALPPVTLPTIPTTLPTKLPNPVPAAVAPTVTQACDQLAAALKQAGQDPTALTTACGTLVNGGGGTELRILLNSPSIGCLETAPLVQNNAQVAAACAQLTAALQPYSSQVGSLLSPVLGLLP